MYTPEPPVGQPDIAAIVAKLDGLFAPIDGGAR
jgi:hypothetical protein